LVALLGVSHQAAAAAVNQLATLSASNGGLDPSLPEFAAVAADLHVSPKQRLQAPDATKAGDDRASTGTKANSASRAGAADLLSGAAAIDSLAQQRAVDHNRAASAGQQLSKIAAVNEFDPRSAAFRGVADSLG